MDNFLSLEDILSNDNNDDISLDMKDMDIITTCEFTDIFEDLTVLEANTMICEAAKLSCDTDEEYNNIITVEENILSKFINKVKEIWRALVDFIKSVFLKVKSFFLNTEEYWKENKDSIMKGLQQAKDENTVSLKYGIIINDNTIALINDIHVTMNEIKKVSSQVANLTSDNNSTSVLNKDSFVSGLDKASKLDYSKEPDKNGNIPEMKSNTSFSVTSSNKNEGTKGVARDLGSQRYQTNQIYKHTDYKSKNYGVFGINTDNLTSFLEKTDSILNTHKTVENIKLSVFKSNTRLLESFMCNKTMIQYLTEAKNFASQQVNNNRFKSDDGAKASFKFCKLVRRVITSSIRVVQMGSFEALKVCKAAVDLAT